MKFTLKNYLIGGVLSLASIFNPSSSGGILIKNNSNISNEIETRCQEEIELEKYPTTAHYFYEIQKNSKKNFHDVNKLEKVLNAVKKKEQQNKFNTKSDVLDLLEETGEEIRKLTNIDSLENNCDDYSYINLSVAEEFNLESYLVFVPGHVFTRHYYQNKNGERKYFNWEATLFEGIEVSDNFYEKGAYIRGGPLPKELIEKGVYMKNLTNKEKISIPLFNSALEFYDERNFDSAISRFTKVIELNPLFLDAYLGRGDSFLQEGKYDLAIKDFNRLIELNPNDPFAYELKSKAYSKKGN